MNVLQCSQQINLKYTFSMAGFDMGKKSRTHWVTLSKSEMESADYYECIVHDDSGRVGFKSVSAKLTVKDQLDNLGNGTGSGGIVPVFFQ